MPKKKTYTHIDRLARYQKIISKLQKVELEGGSLPYTLYNGNMFSFLSIDCNLGLRMPEEEINTLLKNHNAKLCEANGVSLKGFVWIPDNLFFDTIAIDKYLQISLAYVQTLKPKGRAKKNITK